MARVHTEPSVGTGNATVAAATASRWARAYGIRHCLPRPAALLLAFLFAFPALATAAVPVTDLSCVQVGDDVELNWTNGAVYDSIEVLRDGTPVALLSGLEVTYTDIAPGAGNYTYALELNAPGCTMGSNDCSIIVIGPPPPSGDFRRGDANNDSAVVGLTDGLFLLNWSFNGGAEPPCLVAADVNGDQVLSPLTDALVLLCWTFGGCPSPPAPFPTCGPDPTSVQLIGCMVPSCP